MKQPLNHQQQEAVATRRNVVVSAGAGSGKTRVLAERYLSLVRSGASTVDRILTLTFTRKAAAEMYDRIHLSLQAAAVSDQVARRQLEQFDQAHISTLDAFAATILRDAPGLFGLGPDVRTDVDELSRNAERSTLTFLHDHADDPILSTYLANDGFKRVLDSPFLELAQFHLRISHRVDFSDLADRQIAWLVNERERLDEELRDQAVHLLDTPLTTAAVAAAKEGITRCGDDPEALCAFVRTIRGGIGGNNAEGQIFREDLRAAKESAERRDDVAGLLGRQDELRQLADLLSLFQDHILESRRRSGVLSYTEVFELAVSALKRDAALRAYYKKRFDFIMIDEFQDNNASQRDLLFILSERRDVAGTGVPTPDELNPEKLFFVGDQKQSIYRFRGADVSVFKRLAADFAPISLRTNYRSQAPLINFFNTFFAELFAGHQESFDAEFEPLEPALDTDGVVPSVVFALVEDKESDFDDRIFDQRAEASWIADQIIEMTTDQRWAVPADDSDASRKPRCGDIAILLRAGSNQQRYEQALRKRGIPYQTHALRSLFLEAPASDFYHLLQLLFYPDDRVAYAALLRGPLVRVSDEALVRILHEDSGSPRPFLPVSGLNARDEQRYSRGGELYREIAAIVDRRPLAFVLDQIWHRFGYRYSLLSVSRFRTFREHFVYLHEIARSFANRPAIEFVDYLRSNIGGAAKVDDAEIATGDSVSIMTIHRSKGLEFPIVFVADSSGKPRADRKNVWADPTFGLTVALPDEADTEKKGAKKNVLAKLASTRDEEESASELRRLLYVAATRAKVHLLFSGTSSPREGSVANLVAQILGHNEIERTVRAAEFPRVRTVSIPPITEETWNNVRFRGIKRTRHDIESGPLAASVVSRRAIPIDFSPSTLHAATGRPAGGAQADEESAALLGTVVHETIERLVAGTPPINAHRRALVSDDITRKARELCENFLACPAWREFAAAWEGSEVTAEVPFLFYLPSARPDDGEEAFLSGVADMVFVYPDRVAIVDFKTDSAVQPDDHRVQIGIYRRAFAEIYSVQVSAYLAYVRHGKILPMVDDPDDDELRVLVGEHRNM